MSDLIVREIKDPKYPGKPRTLSLYVGGKLARYKHWELRHSIPPVNDTELEGEISVTFQPFEYQETIIREALGAMMAPPHTYFLSLATGMGKTKIAIYVFSVLRQRTLVVVPTVNLAEQWREQFALSIAPARSCIAGIPGAKKGSPSPLPDIHILVINTARKMPGTFFAGFGLVIFDEVHEYTSESSKNAIWGANESKYILGLSATPDTGNGLLPFLEGHLGPVSYVSAGDDVKYDTLVVVINYYGDDEYTEPERTENGTISVPLSLQKILSDNMRTKRIVEEVKRLYNLHDEIGIAKRHGLRDDMGNLLHKHKIFIFCEYREYLLSLKDILSNEGISAEEETEVPSINVLMGGSGRDDNSIARDGRVILTTYGYSKRGVSFDDFTALVMATPRKREHVVDQLIGRIFRVNGPRHVRRVIVDIVDVRTPFRHQYKVREEIYIKRGFKIASGCKKNNTEERRI